MRLQRNNFQEKGQAKTSKKKTKQDKDKQATRKS